jgi:hypothetical protein
LDQARSTQTDYDLEERLLECSARIARLVEATMKETDELVRIFARSIQTAEQRKR